MKPIAMAALATASTLAMAQVWKPIPKAPEGPPVVSVPLSHGMLDAFVDGNCVTLAFGNGSTQIQTMFAARTDREAALGMLKAMDRTFPEPTGFRSFHRVYTGPEVPGGMRLPVGFTNVPEQGRDTHVGHIEGRGAIPWRYDIGRLAGDYTDGPASWRVSGKVRGQSVTIAKKSNGTVAVHFAEAYANFVASPKTRSELVIMLASLLTYGLDH